MKDVQQLQRFLRAEQVGRMFGVDRSTIYRMAENARLPAVKVGRQWRFPADQIELLLGACGADLTSYEAARPRALQLLLPSTLPLVELSAQILGVMFVVTDMDGEPATDVINPCPWFSEHWNEPELLATCLADWKELARDPDFGVQFRSGPLNVDCARVFIRHRSQLVGMLVAGCIDPTGDDPRGLYRLSAEGRARVLVTLPMIAAKISRIAAGVLSNLETRNVE